MLNIGDNRNFQRLSGRAYFQATGQAGMICIGNIVMHKLDPKVERKDIMRYENGMKRLARTDVLGVNPEYEIQGDEFNSLNIPILIWGDRVADSVQQATGALTATINGALPGMTYALGGYVNAEVATVTPTAPANAAPLVEGTDFAVDAMKGLVTFLAGGAVPVGGGSYIVAFSAAAVTRETYTTFTNMQRRGVLALYEIDSPEDSNLPLNSITYPVTLYCDSDGEAKVDDNQKFTLRARLTGPGKVLRRIDNPALAE